MPYFHLWEPIGQVEPVPAGIWAQTGNSQNGHNSHQQHLTSAQLTSEAQAQAQAQQLTPGAQARAQSAQLTSGAQAQAKSAQLKSGAQLTAHIKQHYKSHASNFTPLLVKHVLHCRFNMWSLRTFWKSCTHQSARQ